MSESMPAIPEVCFRVFVDASIDWFRVRARRAQLGYNGLRSGLIVASAALPAFTASAYTQISTVLAVLVAALAALDTQLKPGEAWRHHRSTQLSLMRIKRGYQQQLITGVDQKEAQMLMYNETEALLKNEAERYWLLRITEWKASKTN